MNGNKFFFWFLTITGTYLSGGAACKWYFNLDIKENKDYYAWFMIVLFHNFHATIQYF
jgi:hypothetical protein